jgi:GT2 family glycosyltransferase
MVLPARGGQMIEISVIVINWNGRQYLQACLEALASQQASSSRRWSWTTARPTAPCEFVRAQFPAVRVVAPPAESSGFAGGNNAGAREARGRPSGAS